MRIGRLKIGRLECDLYVQPLGSVDSLVSRIPLLGYILAGKDSTVLVYRFSVSGKISAPEVEYVPLRDLGRSALGYIKRLLMTPRRIFRALSDAAENNVETEEPEIWRGIPALTGLKKTVAHVTDRH